MIYGHKRDYRKIDIYINGKYECSTNWSKSCRDARKRYAEAHALDIKTIKAEYAK